ncbi:Hypothetical protein PHPALM_21298 [Phytophthora palmivora]|uniref:PiggyBac transposable element-derived protein domain-containing protein n=1 Tax=Phytophthora palmivora TaxID=4796 RepID=A0A2P4XCN8_9STRA|nr:Hypothetical protein PHPALM_21298 [Phytophthora palmivora]
MARIRTSQRRKPAERRTQVIAHDVDFGHQWRQLRAAGWKSKRPAGLQTEWSYISPAGGHVFVGERAVVNYAFTSGLLEEDSDAHLTIDDDLTHAGTEEADDDQGEQTDEIRASQIDTSIQLSQRTVNAMFGSSSEDEIELSQAAVPRVFSLSPGDLEIAGQAHTTGTPDKDQGTAAGDDDQGAAAGLCLLSEASGLESEGDVAEEQVMVPRRSARNPPQSKIDLNYVQDGEDTDDYKDWSSGGSDDDVTYDSGNNPDCEDFDDVDSDVVSDGDAVELEQVFIEWTPISSEGEADTPACPGLGTQEASPVAELLDVWRSPLLTLFFFMPKAMWVNIAAETNRYGLQQVTRRAEKIQERQTERRRETVKQIVRRLKAQQAYGTHEIMHVVGLLVVRMLCPQKRRFSAHWSMVEDGAIPAGNFGRYIARDRCQNILRDLHFVDNTTENRHDKLWKLRPVVDKIRQRLLEGWTLPVIFSFDEGVLPFTSRRNTTRMLMSDKPHRFEVYVGRRSNGDGAETSVDYRTGAAAVVLNLKVVLDANSRHPWHAVVVDRYYSSVLLAVELLGMQVYVVGTVMTNRLGIDKNIKSKSKTRPKSIPRGTFTFSRSVAVPSMVTFLWWDRKPVYYLCTGSAMTPSTISRKIKRVGAIEVACPKAVNDYQDWMGRVDRHDQLRLQSHSLQMSTKFRKYYKSLFLGLLDLALVNAYITHKEGAKIKKTVVMKRSEWFCVLQNQLLQLKAEDFVGVEATSPLVSQKRKRTTTRLTHGLQQSEDWVVVSGVQKRRQSAKCWLCPRICREYKGVGKTYYDIWHEDFGAGEAIPASIGKRVVLRRPGKKAGRRQQTRRELRLEGQSDHGGNSSGDGDGDDEEGS